ncbi:MAG: polyprenyl synthetase family protein [SAR202 cluster bacterium]|nr:dimethylallyltranstransferase [Chloroflexota bacterium]MQG51096.1 polyprenyl synthetase family protein [SAR202 cluster bacterium]|tara:strand:+ start:570 stop:1634 length:1065 start_codon:yes stop_codon:yes gene_type:complete
MNRKSFDNIDNVFSNPPECFDKFRLIVDQGLFDCIGPFSNELKKTMGYHLGFNDQDGNLLDKRSAGKSLRPTLSLLVCESLTSDYLPVLYSALAIELIHNFSLIHDDIQDRDTERRHQKTVWTLWGEPRALWIGNTMRSLADSTQSNIELDSTIMLKAAELLSQASMEMIEGQFMDVEYEKRLHVTSDEYLLMISRKTGALIRCASELGALHSLNDEYITTKFRDFGSHLGRAFQIRDDVLGIWGDTKITGKPVGSDILRKKKTYPILLALDVANEVDNPELASLMFQSEISDLEMDKIITIMSDYEVFEKSQNMIEYHSELALECINSVKDSLSKWGYNQLCHLTNYLAYRLS